MVCAWTTGGVTSGKRGANDSERATGEVFVEDVNASGTMYSESSYSPISITVANPAPTTSLLIPSNGATVSGMQLLDASASCNNGQVGFEVTGPAPPPFQLYDQSVAPVA